MMKKSTYDVSHHSAVCGVTGNYYRISVTYHIKRSIRVFLIILCCLLPGGVFAGSLINAGFISPDNVNLSIRDFLGFYASDNLQEKDNTLMYVLGVADATEGKTWCGYGQVDSITINHTVLTWFEQHVVKKPDARASVLIEEALVKNFPCQRTDSSIKIASRSSPILSLTPDALNLSGNDFFKFWVSGNQRDKLRAGVYLLGVEDATENKLWCGYALFKTLTLNELVYVSLKNKTNEELNSRAAELIINKLIEYPCNI
ncbi:hypothetical protein DNM44_05045 [Salmonella enterica subsp. enterica]|uniref:Rap1a immunity protein domain-containing protein n=2 Tax=Salmonella enterica I TaxID=59201 RepID=A0A5I6CB65_SALET|nr:Rap1a/Tai family immunity protein [Salmonella enterica]EAA2611969.1 hypothetical protein [Salmonella enterica subsp. enterica serovar Virchow]EAA4688811.1 hypothetical protein [Salmonella enterica subsp. enterica serovar Hull]EAW1792917.1 hypothetical protein [Salmonella enterica subsp. enterica]HAE0293274.1 hypothetical protein [Salmonella enterica subsp. enterica serovar Enteritidis str. P125109]HCM7002879.1 hypothetical protein [Salmonella enterica subsp. enterica serovar Typhimurium str